MKNTRKLVSTVLLFCFLGINGSWVLAQENTIKLEKWSMPRSSMYIEDDQLWLFNGIGAASPVALSVTGITNLKFTPREFPAYHYHLTFLDNRSGLVIHDDAQYMEKVFLERYIGEVEPNSANFRPHSLKMLIYQDDIWQPNQSYRKGGFHYKLKEEWVSFGIETWTSVSGSQDEVLQKIRIVNRDSKELDLTLVPNQILSRKLIDIKDYEVPAGDKPVYELTSGETHVLVASDIPEEAEQGFRIKLPALGVGEYYIAIQVVDNSGKAAFKRYQPDIKYRLEKAHERSRERLQLSVDRLPKINTADSHINELYNRCMLTVSMCKWERDGFIVNPFWASGGWIISMIWDQCFAEDVIAMLDPQGQKEAIKINLRESKMEQSYINYKGVFPGILYIQDPFALQTMINAYITYTGDRSIMDEKTGDATVYEWMKRWAYKLRNDFSRPDGLIDVENPEHLIEIRTGGYDRVVPVVNGLAADFYRQMAEWAAERGDKEAEKFAKWGEQIKEAFLSKSWNDEKGWFDNLYPDGGRGTTFTYHTLDLLEGDIITPYQKARMVEHIKDGGFLAPYGMWSISKTDTLHWDRVDADFGGGGQYVGMTLRIAKSLYKNGFSEKGFEILKRFSKYTEHFPYISGNPWSDKMFQNKVSLYLQISSGAGLEAIISGIFGVRPQTDGSIVFDPTYHSELGKNPSLTDFSFRGDTYDVMLNPYDFTVKKNGRVIAVKTYDDKLVIR